MNKVRAVEISPFQEKDRPEGHGRHFHLDVVISKYTPSHGEGLLKLFSGCVAINSFTINQADRMKGPGDFGAVLPVVDLLNFHCLCIKFDCRLPVRNLFVDGEALQY